MKIFFTGGGSGGHIMPLVTVIREIKKKEPSAELFYIGPKSPYDDFIKKENVKISYIFAGKIRRYFSLNAFLKNILDILFFIPVGFFQSLLVLLKHRKGLKCVFSKGGYGSLGPSIAASLLDIPVLLHESDIAVGLSNRVSSIFAKKIFLSFPPINKKQNQIVTGNPIRQELFNITKEEGIKELNLKGDKPIIFIAGGSQGSVRINNAVLESKEELTKEYEVVHMCGKDNYDSIQAKHKKIEYYHLFGFLDERQYAAALVAADLVVSRAGAGSIFEIAASATPSILIPITESAQNHQYLNAKAYEKTGGCIVLEEKYLDKEKLIHLSKFILGNAQKIEEMRAGTQKLKAKDSASIISNEILNI